MKKDQTQAKILNIKLSSTSKVRLLTSIEQKIAKKQKFTIFTPNPEIILAAQKDPKLASILNESDISIPDGVGLKLADPSLTIIKGRLLMLDLLELANRLKMKVYFLGASKKVNKASVALASKRYGNIIVEGSSGPHLDKDGNPVSKKDSNIDIKVIRRINVFKPNFLFVAFGTPKEQKWIAKHKDELKANCIMEVGGALDYFSGEAKLPPVFFTSFNLEWLWRLFNEPKRASRIFNAVIVFPFRILLSKIGLIL